jgi:hypothetical protein
MCLTGRFVLVLVVVLVLEGALPGLQSCGTEFRGQVLTVVLP